ncbi:flavin monoamine oxidase family protein [Psychroflexus planctonicus]|uniref:Monoamine oxidase n=1 Tax=Psychroflexus planctonicus TaxID=1526575 RepID=A0ABQ1SGK7_9FLAO|nr:FAD-dependent oxidoreductase [Psychroflexus planctonicus]GGE28580.1 monoamine oxidase [Psychroflexus planctonicus]
MNTNTSVLIVGAGLSGLSLGYFLKKQQISFQILEASNRVGGRIQTINGKLNTPMELGATWFAKEHLHLNRLLNELGIEKFKQYRKGTSFFHTEINQKPQEFEVHPNEPVTYRIAGGTERLIEAIYKQLDPNSIHLNCKAEKMEEKGNQLHITSSENMVFEADYAVICMPPQLIYSSLNFVPSLPDSLLNLLPDVQTWMAGSIKFVLEFNEAFWRENKHSGMLFSHVGIVTEMYDHTDIEENKFGFTGFLHPNASQLSKDQRKKEVIYYLNQFFGKNINSFVSYEDKIWNAPTLVGNLPLVPQAHLNNGDALLKKAYYNGKLFFGGTETSEKFPGYMDSAVASAYRIVNKIKENDFEKA